jgi:magnesium chelatase family protein
MRVDVPPVSIADLAATGPDGEGSAAVAARVARGRAVQAARQDGALNAHVAAGDMEKTIILQEDAKALLTQAAERLRLSARGYHRLLRVARTVADLGPDPAGPVDRAAAAEALGYRALTGA